MVASTKTKAEVFNLRTPYLKQGRTTDLRARTDLMTIMVKIYAEGGENALHCHTTEDHTFIVVEGQATFRIDTEDNVKVVNKWEGVMLPKGVYYRFESTGDENLVLIRAGATPVGMKNERLGPDGRPLFADSKENGRVDRIEAPGIGFGG
jgi:mannose-6-phosphate isomerase-like protein (cupin superfamily)